MLGRTDSRRRLLFLLFVFVHRFVRAGGPPGLLAGGRPAAARGRGAVPDHRHARHPEQARRHLRPDRDRRPGHDRPARAPRRGARPADRRPAPTRPSRPWPRSSGSTTRGAIALRDKLSGNAKYVILRHGLEREVGDQIQRRDRRQERLRDLARTGTRARLPAGRRRPRLEPRRAPARLRQPRGRRAVRRRAGVPVRRSAGEPRIVVADRDASGQPILDDATVTQLGPARDRPDPDHRRRSAAAGRAGAPGGLDRRQGQERLGGRHGPVHRRGLRDGDLPVLRRQ